MKKHLLIIFLSLGLSIILSACNKEKNPPPKVTTENVVSDTKQALDTTVDYLQQKHDEYVREAKKQLADLQTKIEELKSQADGASKDVRAKMEKQILVLQEKRKATEKKLAQLNSASEKAWEQIKSGFDKAMEDLKLSYQNAKKQFQ